MRRHSRIRELAARWLPAAIDIFVGSSPECMICGRLVGRAVSDDERMLMGDLHIVLKKMRHMLCGRCIDSISWIREVKCDQCGRAVHCPDCERRNRPALVANRAAVQYDGQMKEWLAAYKFSGHERLLPIFSYMLDYALARLKEKVMADSQTWNPIITYVPISDVRMQERGFNQAARLAEQLARNHRLPCLSMLIRTRHTSRQSHKSRIDRMKDLQGAFELAESLHAEPFISDSFKKRLGKNIKCEVDSIVIVDDVYTTGSTIHECAEALSEYTSLPIYGLTWAR